MEKFSNIQFFVNGYNLEKFPSKLYNLLAFTHRSKVERDFCGFLFFNIKKQKSGYSFKYNNKEYYFKVFSDFGLFIDPLEMNYFGVEIKNDLKKNEKILKK